MLRTNEGTLVEMAVQGAVMPPKCYGWEVTQEGTGAILPAVGGITYNVRVGDPAFGWEGDHVEPGVSLTASRERLDANPNRAFNAYACVGNRVRLISGAAAGRWGVVTGRHGGVEHVLVDFPEDVMGRLTMDDKVLIRAWGTGLSLLDAPGIKFFGMSPRLLRRMRVRLRSGGRVEVPVAAVVPPELMGSGVGQNDSFKGAYDIQTQDMGALREHGLDELRLGDIVALMDQDCRFGFGFRRGAVSIGLVIHCDSRLTGHGPGVQVLMTAGAGLILPRVVKGANIADYLGIGRGRKKRTS